MSIKSDVWIKRMSREHKLIDPFEEKLVRNSRGSPRHKQRAVELRLRLPFGAR